MCYLSEQGKKGIRDYGYGEEIEEWLLNNYFIAEYAKTGNSDLYFWKIKKGNNILHLIEPDVETFVDKTLTDDLFVM